MKNLKLRGFFQKLFMQ